MIDAASWSFISFLVGFACPFMLAYLLIPGASNDNFIEVRLEDFEMTVGDGSTAQDVMQFLTQHLSERMVTKSRLNRGFAAGPFKVIVTLKAEFEKVKRCDDGKPTGGDCGDDVLPSVM